MMESRQRGVSAPLPGAEGDWGDDAATHGPNDIITSPSRARVRRVVVQSTPQSPNTLVM